MSNLIFSLNATMPIFLTMILGLFFRKVGILDESFTSKMNKFVFKIALPVLLFQDLSDSDFSAVWDIKFVLFCFFATLLSILAVWGLSHLLKERSARGEFIQAAYRSSAAILGIAFIQNIYGNSGMAPLMIISSVPLYNIMAVVVLAVFGPEREEITADFVKKTAKNIVTNPIILGIAAGLLWSVLRIPKPVILQKTVQNIAVLATPLGLIAMGASFEAKSAAKNIRPSIAAAAIKLVGLAAVFLPIAVILGFRQEKLVAILVMLGSATTVSLSLIHISEPTRH